MRIIQIIDSLEAGGAERMALNYANVLASKIEFSGLVTTRKEGALLTQIDSQVAYLFLNKKKLFDVSALFRLQTFVLKNKITHIHAHSTSFFLAFLLKMIYPSVKIIWHLHNGASELLPKWNILILRMILPFFNGIIVVNQNLKNWSKEKMKLKNVIYLPNFPSKENEISQHTILKGIEGKRIVSLANLRTQKNHLLLLEVAQKLKNTNPDWTFHLVGKDFEDSYSEQIKKRITDYCLENNVFLYDSKQDVGNILNQASIAILTSQSEGLPVALLEYGLHKKAVVVTSVGEIPKIVQHGKNGFITDSNQADIFYKCLVDLIGNEDLRITFGEALYNTIQTGYTVDSIIYNYLNWLQKN